MISRGNRGAAPLRSVQRGGLRLLTFPGLDATGVRCALSTRPLDARPPEGQRRLAGALGFAPDRVASPRQVHRSEVAYVTGPPADPPHVDGLVTDVPGLALVLRAADCSLIVVVDPERRAVGVAHAGWRGSARGIVVNLVKAFARFGSDPADLRAAIGPTIGVDRYPVGPDVPAAFLKLRSWASDYVRVIDSHLHFDLAGANRRFLVEAGVPADRIEDSGLCTYDERDLLHSFRREGTGAGHHALCAGFPDAPGDPEEPTPPRRA